VVPVKPAGMVGHNDRLFCVCSRYGQHLALPCPPGSAGRAPLAAHPQQPLRIDCEGAGDFTALTRAFTPSENIDRDRISATLEDGILHLILPKTETAKVKNRAEILVSIRRCKSNVCWVLLWLLRSATALAILSPARLSYATNGIEELLQETYWGESSGELVRQFGDEARRLPQALDFGDSYTDVILTRQTLGGVPMVVFFQMDKATRGLKRIQLERPRHGVNPPSFRAIVAALHADYGKPDQTCVIPVLPASGYQAAAEERWARDGAVISAIFRDTTLQAFEGCLFGPATGWCGLRGQLLVRIGPPDGDADPCSLTLHDGPAR
jgi:hypothetical protein